MHIKKQRVVLSSRCCFIESVTSSCLRCTFSSVMCRKKTNPRLSLQELKLNKSFVRTLPKMAEILVQMSTCMKLREYTIIYLKDFPHLSSLDLTHWRSILLHDKVQIPTWFPLQVQSVPQLLTSILRKGRPLHAVYYLPGTTHRLETLIKVTCLSLSAVDHY